MFVRAELRGTRKSTVGILFGDRGFRRTSRTEKFSRRRHTCHGVLRTEFNFCIDNGNLFGDESHRLFNDEPVTVLPNGTDFHDILVLLGVFPSKSQVRKDPKWGSQQEIPEGFTTWHRVGKLRLRIDILRPCPVDREENSLHSSQE